MPNMLEDGMTSMMQTLLANAGSVCVYSRASDSDTLTMHKRPQMPQMTAEGEGVFTEILMTDFLIDSADLPYAEPERGDQISVNGETYSVHAGSNGKVYRKLADSLLRIHTVRIK